MPETPVKKVKSLPSDLNNICRTCSVNIPISGRGRHNIFGGTKSVKEKLAERLSDVLQFPIVKEDVVSSIICSKCKRELDKLERYVADLQRFKEMATNSAREQRNLVIEKENTHERFKRCKGNSPSIDGKNKRRAGTVQRNLTNIPNTTQPVFQVHEDLIVHLEPKARNPKIRVTIFYPSSPVTKAITNELDARIIRGIASNERNSVANAVWECEDIKEFLLRKLEKDVKDESGGLCSRKNPSLLTDSKKESIVNLKDSSVVLELKERAPTLERVLRAACSGKGVRGKDKKTKATERENRTSRAISMATSVLMKCRNPSMSAMAYRVSILLWHGGAEKQAIIIDNLRASLFRGWRGGAICFCHL